jgi:DNA-directed RNA polymerase subunit RPC12/RpoP
MNTPSRRQLLRDAKKCVDCKKPLEDYKERCNHCHFRTVAMMRKRLGCNAWRPGGRGRPPKVKTAESIDATEAVVVE